MLYLSAKVTLLFAFRYFFIIYFYICSVNTDCVKDMQTLLNDIELDIQELKCLMQAISSDANPTLKIVAKRNIQQMKARLEALQELLEEATTAVVSPLEEPPAVTTPLTEPVSPVESVIPDTVKMVCEEPETVPILAERIKPAKDLKHAISLNDSFRFVRELFAGDAARMNEVVRRLGEAPSLDKAMDIFASEVHPDEENEAAVVREIFNMFLNGNSREEIASVLRTVNAPTRKDVEVWAGSTVYHILRNERYAGNALLGKFYTTDTFPHKKMQNRGEREQRFFYGTNPAIVTMDVFERTQALLKQRDTRTNALSKERTYEKLLQCPRCGCALKRKTSSGKEYWVCQKHFEDSQTCNLRPVPTGEIEQAFCRLYYKLKHHSEPIFTQMLSNLQKIRYSRMLWSEDVISLNKKISDILSQVQFLTQLQQAGGVDPDTFISSNNKLSEQLRRLKQEKARLLDTDSDDLADRTRDLMDALEDGPDFLDSFDAELFDALVEKIIVDSNERLRFRLKNGLELTEQIERTRR